MSLYSVCKGNAASYAFNDTRFVMVELRTSIQRGGTVPHDGLSVSCSSAPPQVEAVVAVAVQALQGEVGDRGVVDCHHLHGAVITLHD